MITSSATRAAQLLTRAPSSSRTASGSNNTLQQQQQHRIRSQSPEHNLPFVLTPVAMAASSSWGALLRRTAAAMQHRLKPASFDMSKRLVLWDFTQREHRNQWFATSDADIGGSSEASWDGRAATETQASATATGIPDESAFAGSGTADALAAPSPGSSALFSGRLSTHVPVGSEVRRSGYALCRSKPPAPTLFGSSHIDLSAFSGFELEVRGDGRTYIANIQTGSLQDDDLYQAFVYTRGGPMWQTVHVAFADFLLTNRGYVQNEQTQLDAHRFSTLGFLLADRVDGPFDLEIRRISAVLLERPVSNMDASPIKDS
eukprot:m.15766 g.15766  ORF g.15766 m.15766 type:complete len:317 (-) comp5083_c0_seq1:16-966(-)